MPQLKRPLITRDASAIDADTNTNTDRDTDTQSQWATGDKNANRRPQQST